MIGTLIPRRRHVLSLTVQADTIDELSKALEQLAFQAIFSGFGSSGASGGVSSGWTHEYSEDPSVTPEVYQARQMHYVELLRAERAAANAGEVQP